MAKSIGSGLMGIIAALGLVGCGPSEMKDGLVSAEGTGTVERAVGEIDILPYICPSCVGKARTRNVMTNGECFQSQSNSSGSFRMAKSCAARAQKEQAYEDFSFDNSWIYHRADTTWAAWNGSSWGPIYCSNGAGKAYNTYLKSNSSVEGGDWLLRRSAHAQQYWASYKVQGKAWSNCANCPTPYEGPGSHLVVMHDLGAHRLGNGEVRNTIRITKLQGVGAGENYWYAQDLGWVAFHKSPENAPMDWNINAANAQVRLQGWDYTSTPTQGVCQ